MSKGYVKALAKQISGDNGLTTSRNRLDNSDNSKGNGIEVCPRSKSPSPSNERKPSIKANYVQNMVQAAEQQNESLGNHSPSRKRPSCPNIETKYRGLGLPSERKLSLTEKSTRCSNNTFLEKPPPKPPSNLSLGKSPQSIKKMSPSGQPNISKTPPTPSRKPSLTNGSKPSIPHKPAALSALPPRKPSVTPPSPLPSSTHRHFSPSPPEDSESGPIYAQVNKDLNGRLNGESKTETSNCEKTDEQSPQNDVPEVNVVLRTVDPGRTRRDSEQYRDSVFNTIYDNRPPLSAAELFDSSWSDSDSYKDFSDDDEGRSNDRQATHKDESDSIESAVKGDGSHEDRRFKIAGELLKTEQDYVAMLHLLHEVFYTRLSEENSQQQLFPPDVLKHIFSNTKSIYLFHNDFLLPQLENRMKNWDNDPRIGDLMKRNAPFLILYSEYINNFSYAMKLLKDWLVKSSRFSSIIQEIQKDPACGNLSLQHHMLGPIQRVPRYELLLKDYVKHLPADSPDMSDSKDALDLVTKAACHSNAAIEKIETFRKLLDIYQNLRNVAVDFISPTREFVMQGPITKISARSREKQPRYIFLFNDLVLICSQYLLGTYNVRSEMQVENMEIKPGGSMNIPNTFIVHSKQKAVELLDETSSQEPLDWEQKLRGVTEAYKMKKRPIKQDEVDYIYENSVPDSCLGKVAPVWISDDAATMCMRCGSNFGMMRRRHHCRSCGWLVCKSCSNKAPLEYRQGKIERVCTYCYDIIVNKACDLSPESPVSTVSNGNSPKKKSSVKVKASDPGLISSYLQCSEDGGKTWQRLWVTAHADFVLYTFRAHEDMNTVSILPLPGYSVHTQTNTFSLKHKKKSVMYQTDDGKKSKRWVSILQKLVKAELPDDSLRDLTQSNSSVSSQTNTTTTTSDEHCHTSDQSECEDHNDEKADTRSQYDNIDP